MRLLLDHHFPTAIAVQLRTRGHDVLASQERDLDGHPDEALLSVLADEGRAVLTNNVRDFTLIVRRWAAEGQRHSGVVFTSDVSLPRDRRGIGSFVERLDGLMAANPADDAFVDRIHWL